MSRIFSSNHFGFGIQLYYNLIAERATAAYLGKFDGLYHRTSKKRGYIRYFAFYHTHTPGLCSQQSHLPHGHSLCTPSSFFSFHFFFSSTFEKVGLHLGKYYFLLARSYQELEILPFFTGTRVYGMFLLSCKILGESYLARNDKHGFFPFFFGRLFLNLFIY